MRVKKIIRELKNAIKQEHLYSSEELEYMKEQLDFMEKTMLKALHKEYKGFGKK